MTPVCAKSDVLMPEQICLLMLRLLLSVLCAIYFTEKQYRVVVKEWDQDSDKYRFKPPALQWKVAIFPCNLIVLFPTFAHIAVSPYYSRLKYCNDAFAPKWKSEED